VLVERVRALLVSRIGATVAVGDYPPLTRRALEVEREEVREDLVAAGVARETSLIS